MSRPSITRALVLCGSAPSVREHRLVRVLSSFGIASTLMTLSEAIEAVNKEPRAVAVLGSIDVIAAVHSMPAAAAVRDRAAAIYAYAAADRSASEGALRLLLPDCGWRLEPAAERQVTVAVRADEDVTLTGPMTGLSVRVTLGVEDSLLVAERDCGFRTVVAADHGSLFVAGAVGHIPFFFCASPAIVDLDEPVRGSYYDVKGDFAHAVPLVTFMRWAFASAMWQPHELGACLIIDDPLLKHRYGFCDFPHIGELMRRHRFTTNIAFIPWNWRRTSSRGSDFFRSEASRFSVSIHGCDHTAAEFGTTSAEQLAWSASTAQARMVRHRQRTRIEHEPVMVFPQGVFSSQCPDVLKRHGFMAAVNTEVDPVDRTQTTTVGDVWDVAILRYGSFPIYTRRYAFHGIENFAFDMLLGKPCFIVAHHDFFSDGGTKLVALVEQLSSRGCSLQWRSPGEVVRRAYRRRLGPAGTEHVEMYGNELRLENTGEVSLDVLVRKQEVTPNLVAEVIADGDRIEWHAEGSAVVFTASVPPRSQRLFSVAFAPPPQGKARRTTIRYGMSVAARRLLSEFRDEYVQKLTVGPAK